VSADAVAAVRSRYGIPDASALFMGLYTYPPNRVAVDFLVTEVFPRVTARCPDARLVVIGDRVPFDAPWLVNPGRVPYADVPPLVTACRVGTAPIFSGSGTRLKILEYQAAGLPVVSTAKGAEGLTLQAGAEILLAEDAPAFAEHLAALLADPDRAAALGARAQRATAAHYDWPRIMAAFMADLAARAGPAADSAGGAMP
jgi:glycosyltransferase involved in cell wall biosynthesis